MLLKIVDICKLRPHKCCVLYLFMLEMVEMEQLFPYSLFTFFVRFSAISVVSHRTTKFTFPPLFSHHWRCHTNIDFLAPRCVLRTIFNEQFPVKCHFLSSLISSCQRPTIKTGYSPTNPLRRILHTCVGAIIEIFAPHQLTPSKSVQICPFRRSSRDGCAQITLLYFKIIDLGGTDIHPVVINHG